MEKNTLQNSLNELSKGTTNDVDSIMIRDAAGNQYWIAKADLASVLGELPRSGFNGNFNDPANFPKSINGGAIRYNVSSDKIENGPQSAIYGIVEILRRSNEPSYQDHVVQWVYYNRKAHLRMGYRSTNSDTYDWGEWKQIY